MNTPDVPKTAQQMNAEAGVGHYKFTPNPDAVPVKPVYQKGKNKGLPVNANRKLTAHEETGSCKFNTVDGVEFWFTAINRVFILFPGTDKVAFPSLQGSGLRFDDPSMTVSAPVADALRTVLKKQREIRQHHWTSSEEDKIAWTYHD